MLQVINNSALEVCREYFYVAEYTSMYYVEKIFDNCILYIYIYIYIYINKVDYEKPLI